MVKPPPTRAILALAALAALVTLAVATAGTSPADAGGHTGRVVLGTTESLSPQHVAAEPTSEYERATLSHREIALLDSWAPVDVVYDATGGVLISVGSAARCAELLSPNASMRTAFECLVFLAIEAS